MSHTPRFTAKAPDTRKAVAQGRMSRCITVKACDIELRELVTRLGRTSHPETVAGLHADIDAVLDVRTALAWTEAEEEALRLAREA